MGDASSRLSRTSSMEDDEKVSIINLLSVRFHNFYMVHCSHFDNCLQNVSVVLISSSKGESSPAKLPKRIMDSDDVVSVHAGFVKFAGSMLSLL